MAYFSVAPTLCEITYDVEKDERVTPYRYQCWSANSRPSQGRSSPTFTETVNFSLPSGCNVSYYEYLRTLYDSRISSPTKGHHGSGTGPGHYSARSYYPTTTNTFPISSPIHENRPKTAAPYIHTSIHPSSLPSIHPSIYPSWGIGEGEEDGSGEGSRSADERLKWIDALNKWIPEQNQSRAGYLSFVGNAPMVEKLLREHVAATQRNRDFLSHDQKLNCDRFEQHMLSHDLHNKSKQNPEHAFARRLMTLKKREALRKRNAELLEQRKQRKHASSPLSERRQKVRFRTPSYSPKKPPALVERNLISIPKESWEGDKAESDSSSRLGGSSEQSSPRKQVEEDLQSQLLEEEEEEMLTKDLIEEEKDEKSEESLPSPSTLLPPVSMETVEKDAEEVEDEEPQPIEPETEPDPIELETSPEPEPSPEPVVSPVVKTEVEITLPVEEEIVVRVIPPMEDETRDEYDEEPPSKAKNSKKAKKVSSNKLTVAKVKASMQPPQKKVAKPKVSVKSSNRKPKTSKDEKVYASSDAKKKSISKKKHPGSSIPSTPRLPDIQLDPPSLLQGRQREDDVEDKDEKVEEGPAPIPMIGDTKTGPLSLVAGRESAKKTRKEVTLPKAVEKLTKTALPDPIQEECGISSALRELRDFTLAPPLPDFQVSVSEAQARRRQSIQTRVLNFEKKRAPKPPSPPPRPPTPPTPSPPPPPSREISIPDLPTDIGKRQVDIEEPPLPDPSLQSKPTSPNKGNKLLFSTPLKLQQKLRKAFKRDTSYEDELRRAELAEKRRQKQMELLEKMKNRQTKVGMDTDFTDGIPNFDDYGFLAKYCIFNRANLEMYRHTFDVVDDEKKGWLPGLETMIALRGVNNRLTIEEEEYLYRILEMTGYNVSKGADFKLFSVMAALSHKISAVDDWMKILIDSMDFKMLEMKMFMCKTLWECNVDKETNRISLDQLCIELRAGGISQKHENEVREKLQHLQSLDLLDFLTYVPLFIMIHQSVVKNPLNNVRDK